LASKKLWTGRKLKKITEDRK